jgi:hypothetical protein
LEWTVARVLANSLAARSTFADPCGYQTAARLFGTPSSAPITLIMATQFSTSATEAI